MVKALEVFDRHGWRRPQLPRWLGPLRSLARSASSRSRTSSCARTRAPSPTRCARLYERREAQCTFDQPERRLLARARIAMTRLAPDFGGGGGGLPRFLVGGAVLSGVVSRRVRSAGSRSGGVAVWVGLGLGASALIFGAVSWIIVQGAAVAHRRSQLMLHEPLDALWETIGACGEPPRDDSMTFAAIGIALTAVAWFVTPVVVAAVFYLSR